MKNKFNYFNFQDSILLKKKRDEQYPNESTQIT